MGVSVQVDARLSALLRALGALDSDGQFDPSWFGEPLTRIRDCLDNDSQRAAVFDLLDATLPPESGPLVPAGASWHPLLPANDYGNVYLTVEDGVVGAAAAVGTSWAAGTSPPLPSISVAVRLPLLHTGGGPAVAQIGPLDVTVVATLGAAEGITSAGVRVRVDFTGTATVSVRLEDASGAVTAFDPTSMNADAVRAIELLIRSVLAYETHADPAVLSLITHLPGVFGLGDNALTPFPVANPSAVRAWLAGIVGTPSALVAWFGHIAGVLNAAAVEAGATGGPVITGTGTAADPLRSAILEIEGVALQLVVSGGGTAAQPTIQIGAGLSTSAGPATLTAQAIIAAIPLAGTAPAAVLPSAAAQLSIPVSGGTILGGFAWDGSRIVPVLRLDHVMIGTTAETVDLTDAHAVVAAATEAVLNELTAALGIQDNGHRLLALAGFEAATGDVDPTHAPTIGADALAGNLLTAIANVHRERLGSSTYPWSLLFAEIGGLFGLTATVTGAGTRPSPWLLELARDDVFGLSLAAWDDRTATTPTGEHLLRIGLHAGVNAHGWQLAWSTEVLAFDLSPSVATRIGFVGAQNLNLAFTALPEIDDVAGFWARADSLGVSFHWTPGSAAQASVDLTGLHVTSGHTSAGPLDVHLPGTPDPSLPGIGLPIAPGDLIALLRVLLARAWSLWGGDLRAYAIAGLLGLHDDLEGLPDGWPQLLPADATDLAELLADPIGALATYAKAAIGDIQPDGTPLAAYAIGWLGALVANRLPSDPGTAPAQTPAGRGNPDDPWILPIGTAGTDLLCWLDPARPAVPDPNLATATRGEALLASLPLGDLLFGRDLATSGYQLDALEAWIAAGDGLVPYASQVAVPTTWTVGAPVAVRHDIAVADPSTVTQVAAQLAAWSHPPALLLVTASGTSWQAMLAGIDPGHDPDARIDLRIQPADLSGVTAVAGAYVVYLDDAVPGSAAVAGLVTQIGLAADRVRALTGQADVVLIGHGPGGVVARIAAAQAPTGIAGVITVCAPHGGSDLTPLTDAAAADAVRVAAALSNDGTVAMLLAILDGGPAISGVLPPATTYAPDTFAAVPAGLTDTVAGLAIGSTIPTGLVAAMAAAHAPAVPTELIGPTHAGIGARIAIPLPAPSTGGVAADLTIRVDLARFQVDDGPAPDRAVHEITLTTRIYRPGGWLAGDAGTGSTRAVLRARWAEITVTIGTDASGGLTVTPAVALHDAGRPGESAPVLTLDAIMTALATQPDSLTLPTLDGPVGDVVRGCLGALGLLDPVASVPSLAVPALRRLVAAPAGWLGPLLPALLAVIGPAAGATAVTGGGWQLPILAGTQTLQIKPGPWTVSVATAAAPPADTLPAGLLAGLTVNASLVLPSFAATGSATLAIGALTLTTDGAAVTLAMPPWLPTIRLAAGTDVASVAAALAGALPRALVSAALGTFVQPFLGPGVHIPPLDLLILSPQTALLTMLGDGHWFTAAKINGLLSTLSSALGLSTSTQPGLALPGGLVLHAVDPFALRLGGTLSLAGAAMTFDAGLTIPHGAAPAPDGTLGLALPLPLSSTWGTVGMTFGVSESGVALALQPGGGAAPIAILPHFDGLAALSAGAQALLPHLLQDLVTELPTSAVLSATLDVAGALGIYDPVAKTFEGAAQSAALAKMLQPGWLASVAGSGPAVTTSIASLFGPAPKLSLPLGTITASNGTAAWTIPLPSPLTGTFTAALGWDGGGEPIVTLTASAVALGPVVIDTATITVGAQLAATVNVHVAFPGVLAPIAPAITVGLAGGRFSAAILPLGTGTENELALTLAPVIHFAASPDAPFDLALQWGLPLATEVILLAVDGASSTPALLDRPFWAGGPTARGVLFAASLLQSQQPGSTPTLVHPLPDPVAAVLGGIQAAASAVAISISDTDTDTLTLALVHDTVSGRTGLRLSGFVDINTTVSLRFGTAPWLTDTSDGVTLWLIAPGTPGGPPLTLAPGLDVSGLGLLISGDPLVDGTIVIGGAGGLLFFHSTFLDAHGAPALSVTDIGAGGVLVDSYVALAGDDGDSFIAKVLPPSMQAPFDLLVAYRDGKLQVAGTGPVSDGDIEIVIPLDLDLTIVEITELLLGMHVGTGTLSLEAAISGDADVGPLYASIKRVGIIATFGTGGAGLQFRPPDEVGLSIDTSTLRLGGFLAVDAEHGRYVGMIEISVLGKFDLSAIGIITTKMPDGSPGFSLLFIITMKLPVPIALGYGFFFGGAGGLLGINRTVDLDALALGLRTGAAESILFPEDIVRNADAIIRDLEAVFPIQQDQFLIGPMAMITWMSPALITIELGLIIDIGSPLKIAIIGLLIAALPDPDEPVLDLKVAFLGAIDLGTSLLRFDASIYDSYLGMDDFKLTLDGDIAVRLGWGEQPDFVSSIGGFHPAYHPATYLHLPAMRRLTITLLRDNPSLSLTAYFALTANSVQFGSRLDFSYSVSHFRVVGDFGFDVLLQFSPFMLDAAVYANLSVMSGDDTLMGVDLNFHLTGPTPWIARGTASFKVLCFSVSVDFNKQFGPSAADPLVYVSALQPVIDAFTDPSAWAGDVSGPLGSAVSLLAIAPAAGSIVIDAAGVLTVSQRVLPLATDISMVGTSKPDDVSRIDIASLVLGTDDQGHSDTTELFSPAAYQALSDADKLKDASFVPRPGGIRAAGDTALHTDYALPRPATYDLIVDDSPPSSLAPPPTPSDTHDLDAAVFRAFARGGATGKSASSRALRAQRERGTAANLGKPGDAYAVTAVHDLRAWTGDGISGFTDRYTAEQRARTAGVGYQVVPASQVVV